MLRNKCLALLLPLAFCAAPTLAAAPPATRPAAAVQADWDDVSQSLRVLLPPPGDLTVSATRAEIAPSVLPHLRKGMALSRELYRSDVALRTVAVQRYYHLLAIAAFLGDHPAIVELDNARRGSNPQNAAFARHAWYLTRWWPRLKRPADASRILDELQPQAAATPADDGLASLLLQMREDLPADSPLRPEIETLITAHLRGPLAQAAITQFRFAEKRRSLLRKPLSLQAQTLSRKPFSTRALAGQTVLLHFGQTTSPEWEKQHHAFLELQSTLPPKVVFVTVLCDESAEAVTTYLAGRKEIPWTVVRDPDSPADFAAQYGVDQFPTSIVIGPDGMVMAVDITPDTAFLESIVPQP